MAEVTSRFYPETTQYDRVIVQIHNPNQLYADRIDTYLGDNKTGGFGGLIYGRVSPHVALVAAKIKSGDASLEYVTPHGDFTKDNLPPWMKTFVEERDPIHWHFVENPDPEPPAPTLTTVEQRRKDVVEWAKANTGIKLFIRATMNPSQASNPTELDNRRWFAGQIWWAFVVHTLAAAQHDEWLEDENVWPAISRNIEIDDYYFLDHVAVNEWNEAAAYMDSFSRIYQAGRYLTTAPVNIQLVPPQTPVRPTLANGAAVAKSIIYGG